MKNRLTIRLNNALYIALCLQISFLILIFPAFFIVGIIQNGGFILPIDESEKTLIILSLMGSLAGLFEILGFAPVLSKMVVSLEGIELKQPFKKSITHPWSFYTNCDKGYYLYYGMPSYYIVLSNFKLRTDELCHINRMEMNDRCIRIKYNKKNFDALMQMLPPKLSASLENQFKDIKAPKVNLIP